MIKRLPLGLLLKLFVVLLQRQFDGLSLFLNGSLTYFCLLFAEMMIILKMFLRWNHSANGLLKGVPVLYQGVLRRWNHEKEWKLTASSPHDRKPWLDAKLIRKSHMKWKGREEIKRVKENPNASSGETSLRLNPLSFASSPCKSLFPSFSQLSCLCCSRWFRRPNTLESSQKLWVVMRFTEATNLVIKPFWSHASYASF